MGSLTGRRMQSHCKVVVSIVCFSREEGSGDGLVPGDVQCGLLADLHGGNALIPSCCIAVNVLFEEVSWSSVKGGHTLDDSADADFCDESSAAN